jgi:uncharacterized CHY-type Zn-finger protein
MLNKDSLKKLNLSDLKVFCKHAEIKYSRLKKEQLFEEYSRYLACKVIQTQFRKHFYRNAVDCITLENVKYPCFIYRSKHGKHFFYSYESIIKNIMKTGDCRDPMTRENYTDEDLLRLDTSVKIYFPETRYSSTLKIKKNINYARRIRNRENEILSFQTRMDELKTTIVSFIADGIIFWTLTEPFIIDGIEFRSIPLYLMEVLGELKLIYSNVKNYDPFTANCFKTGILDELKNIPNFNTPQVKDIYDSFLTF